MRSSKKLWFLLAAVLCLWMSQLGSSNTASAMQVESLKIQDVVEETQQEAVSEALQEPDLSVGERLNLAFPYKPSGINDYLTRNVANDVPEWPKIHYLGEEVEHYGTTLRLVDYRLVHGKTIATAFFPKFDEIYDAPNGISGWSAFEPIPYIAIPPQTTLLMVKFEVDPDLEDPALGRICGNEKEGINSTLRSESLRVAYPGLGETRTLRTDNDPQEPELDYGEFNTPDSLCMLDGWYYFYIADLDPDPAKIWVMHIPKSDPADILIWTLSVRFE